jgi:hypothetical protein
MRQTTLPPEMLPRAKEGDGEVIVCRNPTQCAERHQIGCPYCLRVLTGADAAMIAIQQPQ